MQCESKNFEALVCEFFNCNEAEVDSVGDIWISGPQTGHWVCADKKADLITWIGVKRES